MLERRPAPNSRLGGVAADHYRAFLQECKHESPAHETPAPFRGTAFGRYHILKPLGHGSNTPPYRTLKLPAGTEGESDLSVYYKALDTRSWRVFAIKTLRFDIPGESPSDEPWFIRYRCLVEHFYSEARIWATLSHPNIVTAFDIGEEAGLPYQAMEFVQGETIAALLGRGRFEPKRVIMLAQQIANALDYMSSRGFMHCHVKPSKLILCAGDRVKITDFSDPQPIDQATLFGESPSIKIHGRSDLLVLGLVCCQMLTRRRSFETTAPVANVDKVTPEVVRRRLSRKLSRGLPPATEEVFARLLAKNADERYPSAGAFVSALEESLGGADSC